MKKEQTMRYTDEELDLIKSTFKDNLPLLKAIRKIFLQMRISESEEVIVKKKIKGDVLALVRKCFLPTLDGDAPINQVIDLWVTLDIRNLPAPDAYHLLKAREIIIDYLDQQLNSFNEGGVDIDIKFNKLSTLVNNPDTAIINLTARNTIVLHIENSINQLYILANQKELTKEEQKELDKKNSTK